MAIHVVRIQESDAILLLSQSEGHFLDFKAKEITPAKLTQSISAFANAEGGELYVGVAETAQGFVWNGFNDQEDANPFVLVFEQLFPLGDEFLYEFVACQGRAGLLLHIIAKKTARIVLASDRFPYLRRNAQKIKIDTEDIWPSNAGGSRWRCTDARRTALRSCT